MSELIKKILGEAHTTPITYYHGSDNYLPPRTVLHSRDDYENHWKTLDSFSILEKYRPAKYLKHKDSVFMVKHDYEIDAAGGGTDYVFLLEPLGKIEKHDMAWGTLISSLLSKKISNDDTQIKQCAENYWN